MNAPGSPAPVLPADATPLERHARWVAACAWTALALLCVAWELWLAPLRPGGSWLVLKVLPLLPWLPGIWRGAPRALMFGLLVILLYFIEATVRVFEPAPYGMLAWIELALALLFFVAAFVHLLPYRRAARSRRVSRV